MRSLVDVQSYIEEIAQMSGCTLNEVLRRFKPDERMLEELKEYLPEWGDMPFHDFMNEVVVGGDDNLPDVWNPEMVPFNIFNALDPVYRTKAS